MLSVSTENMFAFDIAAYEMQGLPIRRFMRQAFMSYMDELMRRHIPLDRIWETVVRVDPYKRFEYQLHIDEMMRRYWMEE